MTITDSTTASFSSPLRQPYEEAIANAGSVPRNPLETRPTSGLNGKRGGEAFGLPELVSNRETPAPVSDDVPPEIDEWLRARGLNSCGDSLDTMYFGGTPLFNESTGTRISRLSYILSRHPYLAALLGINRGPIASQPQCPKPVERDYRNSGLSGYLKRIEEIQAEIRKLWQFLLSFQGCKRARKLLLNKLRKLEKILMLLYMKLGQFGGDGGIGQPACSKDSGALAGPSPVPGPMIGTIPPAAPPTTSQP
jgi:hypothetical protein